MKLRSEPVQPGRQDPLQRRRHQVPGCIDDRGRQLLGVKWQTVGALDDLCHRRCGEPPLGGGADKRRHVFINERGKVDPPHRRTDQPWLVGSGAGRAEYEQRPPFGGQRVDQTLDQFPGRRISPVGVFDMQNGRTRLRKTKGPTDRGAKAGGAPLFGRQPSRGVEGREVRDERTERLFAGQRVALDREPRRTSGVAVLQLVCQP